MFKLSLFKLSPIGMNRLIASIFIIFFLTSIIGSGFLLDALINSTVEKDTVAAPAAPAVTVSKFENIPTETKTYIIKLNEIKYAISLTSLSIYMLLHLPVLYFYYVYA
jgi:hypothetical protein